MKKLKVLMLLTLTAVMLSGCKSKIAPETKAEAKTDLSKTEESQMPTGSFDDYSKTSSTGRETPNEKGEVHSYLTGQLMDVNLAYKRPIAVMLNNIVNSCPQSGLAKAGVVYEAPVEAGITRLMGIFEDYQGVEKIGSVRSCRDYYIDYALEFDAIYTHFGQAVYAVEQLNSDIVNNISGLDSQEGAGKINGYAGEDVFYRSSDRPSPHNVYISEDGINRALEKKGYRTEFQDDYNGHYKFAADGAEVTYTDGTANRVEPAYQVNKPWFEYDSEKKLYNRFQYEDIQIDDTTGEQLAYKNIIFQYSKWENYDKNGYLNVDTNSGGDAVVFTNGTYQRGTWKKDSEWGPVRYYDAGGKEIILNQGKTWVCVIQNDYKDDAVIE